MYISLIIDAALFFELCGLCAWVANLDSCLNGSLMQHILCLLSF